MSYLTLAKKAEEKLRHKDGQPLTPEDREEAKRLAQEFPPPCWNCGATTTETCDIYGREWWACWSCAKWA